MKFSRQACLTAVLLSVASLSYADKAWDQYVGFTKAQHQQWGASNKSKEAIVKPARQDKDASTQSLIGQVLANGGDSVVQPILNRILSDIQTMDNAEDTFWQTVQGFLTSTQVAKVYLKWHQPKPPAAPSNNPKPSNPNPQPPYNWNAYFGFTPDQASQLKGADQAKNTSLKPVRDEKDSALSQLAQLVQSNAADSAIKPTLNTLFADIQGEHQTEQTYWGTTLPGFLSSTQMAKLYLHRHAPQGTFNPPPPMVTAPAPLSTPITAPVGK